MGDITCEWPFETAETYEPLESSYLRLNGAFGTSGSIPSDGNFSKTAHTL